MFDSTAHALPWSPFSESLVSGEDAIELLPAIYWSGEDKDELRVGMPSVECLENELLVDRLNYIQDWLWFAGRPMPPRGLHHQLLLDRKIVITEQMHLHLVWTRQHRLFLKPLSKYVLDKAFWETHLLCPPAAGTSATCGNPDPKDCSRRRELVGCALGFLHSYVALIAHESDFRIAEEHALVPEQVSWSAWKRFSGDFLKRHHYSDLNPRFWYGELRMSRLSKVYRYRYGYLRGYSSIDNYRLFVDFFQDNFALIASILGYIVVIVESLQVGLASQSLEANQAFQRFAYGFAIFAIIMPIAASGLVFSMSVAVYIYNHRLTRSYQSSRFERLQTSRLGSK